FLHGDQAPVAGARTLLGKPTACVGRELELDNLQMLLAECADEPRAHAVLVTAPAGAGKTRLLSELLRRIEQDGPPATIWMGRADPLRAGAAFGLLGLALQGACGIQDGQPIEVRRDKILARVRERIDESEAQRVAEFLGEIVGTPFPDEDSVPLRAARNDAQLMGDQTRLASLDF